MTFDETVASITQTGLDWHRETILRNSFRNAAHVRQTIRDIAPDQRACLIVSAGPSLYREKILSRLIQALTGGRLSWFNRQTPITVVATDGAYIQCLKAGIAPDFVITLDPHPTRMVRWFGDPNFEANTSGDSYFSRTHADLRLSDNSVEENTKNIALVDANKSNLVICTTAPSNVVERTRQFRRYWFAPLVDAPRQGSLTRIMAAATGCPALNTGGTVGTAAWSFAHQVLESGNIAIVGADHGYYRDLPLENTQEWNLLKDQPNVEELFPFVETPFGICRTSPTYTFYRNGFRDLLAVSGEGITNCGGHGTLHGDRVNIVSLEKWLASSS